MGFDVGPTSNIEGCMATNNEGDGINLSNDTLARANTCSTNGTFGGDGAGIHATSSDNRIEANNVTDNDRGIDVDVAGNLILKNSASGNTTNYAIAANNVFGAIVDRTAPASAAVSGNTAPSSAGTIDPWANFAY
jgi:parallel beta-helix repeat protein